MWLYLTGSLATELIYPEIDANEIRCPIHTDGISGAISQMSADRNRRILGKLKMARSRSVDPYA